MGSPTARSAIWSTPPNPGALLAANPQHANGTAFGLDGGWPFRFREFCATDPGPRRSASTAGRADMSVPGQAAVDAVPRPCRARWWRGLAALVVALAALGAASWWGRAPLLRGLAEAWIASDPPSTADLVAVFGGGLETRPFAAAEYYRQGLVKRVLVSDDREGRAAKLGVVLSDAAAARQVLLNLGVRADAIQTFGAGLANTHDEALALRDWAVRHHVHAIIVPTEIFAARRIRWTLNRVFGDAVSIRVPVLDPPGYTAADWWKNEQGVISFQNEIIKYVYYRLRY